MRVRYFEPGSEYWPEYNMGDEVCQLKLLKELVAVTRTTRFGDSWHHFCKVWNADLL